MRYISILIFTLVFANTINSQNYIYFGDNQYEATETWSFQDNMGTMTKYYPKITIAKKNNGGYFMMSISASFKSTYLTGTTIIFLNNGKTIKCFDKGIRDHLNERSIALYSLTNSEIELLKSARITQIRYAIKGGGIGGETKSYTAANKKQITFGGGSKTYETEKAVTELFKK